VEEGRGTSFFDGIRMAAGAAFNFTFPVLGCRPEIMVRVEDVDGGPVLGAGIVLYESGGPLAQGSSGADGTYVFSNFVCGLEYGLRVAPPAGYAVTEGRGSSFFDGIKLDRYQTLNLTFRLRRVGP
jgi:hypothetical protein